MIHYEDWQIIAEGFRSAEPQVLETLFSQSNGYIGARAAFLLDGARPFERCAYLAGGFEYISPGITDMVNLPDLFHCTVSLGGSKPGLTEGVYASFAQRLDMHNGLYQRTSVWKDEKGRETKIVLSRFISMDNKHVSALALELTALNYDGQADIVMGLDAGILNLPIHDDQTLENSDTVSLLDVLEAHSEESLCFLHVCGAVSRRPDVSMTCRIRQSKGSSEDASTPVCPARHLSLPLVRDETVRVEKIIYTNATHSDEDFTSLLGQSAKAWGKRWETSDIQVEADTDTQAALRYNIFQLMQNCPFDDASVNIGARGLTHGRYKGCYFWDTDIFMLPLYIYTDPQAARNLVQFRLDTLQAAKENAKALNLAGARYPWMCASDGKEQCNTWDIGRSEVHITADVPYAVQNYLNVTGDTQLQDAAAQLYVETARYWVSRFSYDARNDVYNLLFAKGPDEYCGVSANNAYTVFLARYNLQLALDAVAVGRADVDADELAQWHELLQKSRVEYDEALDLYIQDDNFLRLEAFPGRKTTDGGATYHEYDFDRLQRYQVIKQADLVLLTVLLPNSFTDNQKRAIWDFYEPLTLHDSSLSWGIHAWAAARLGLEQEAYEYFNKSLFFDLGNLMKNAGREGIHMAALGATWQAVVFGFAGLSITGASAPQLSPQLPKGWKSLRFRFQAGGRHYRAYITHDNHSIEEIVL